MKHDDKLGEISFYYDMGIRTLGFLEGSLSEHNIDTVNALIDGQKGALKLIAEYRGNIEHLQAFEQEQADKAKAEKEQAKN
jgi:hypothetical protein